MQKRIVAAHISNKLKDRPNLSFVHTDTKSQVTAYLIAYEGEWKEPGKNIPHRIVYVDDLVSMQKSEKAGIKVMDAFIQEYLKQYPDTSTRPPIVADMREETTFGFFQRRLAAIATKFGEEFEMEKLSSDGEGSSKLNLVVLRSKLSQTIPVPPISATSVGQNGTNSSVLNYNSETGAKPLVICMKRNKSKIQTEIFENSFPRIFAPLSLMIGRLIKQSTIGIHCQ